MDIKTDHAEVLSAELTRKLENKKRLVFYTSLILLVAGCLGMVLTQGLTAPIEKERMFLLSFRIGAFLCLLLGFLSVFLLRGHATTARAVIPTLLVGWIGLFLCSWVLISYLNCAWDTSTPRTHEVTVFLKQEVPGKRPLFLMVVRSWNNKKEVITIPITRQQYDQIQGDRCRITTKAGRFGFEWIIASVCGPAKPEATVI